MYLVSNCLAPDGGLSCAQTQRTGAKRGWQLVIFKTARDSER